MKKTILYLIPLLTLYLSISSCSKDRVCECKITTSIPGEPSETYSYEIEYEKVTRTWMKNTAGCVNSSSSQEEEVDYIFNPITGEFESIYATVKTVNECEIK